MKVVAIVPWWRIGACMPCLFLEPLLTQLLYIFGVNPDMLILLYYCLCATQNAKRILIGQCIEFFFLIATSARKIYHWVGCASFLFCFLVDFTDNRRFRQ